MKRIWVWCVRSSKTRSVGLGSPEYNDLFQIGCIGLIKAVATDKGGCLSTYAYRLIWNEIRDELVRNTRLILNEQPANTIEILSQTSKQIPDPLETLDLRDILLLEKSRLVVGPQEASNVWN